MTRFAVITDVHANALALEAALMKIEAWGCDRIIHTGDAVGLGPQPRECLETLLEHPRISGIRGNHDSYYCCGVPNPLAATEDRVRAHQEWVNDTVGDAFAAAVAAWPFSTTVEVEDMTLGFQHYALDATGSGFQEVVYPVDGITLDTMFAGAGRPDLVFYGHVHASSDQRGIARYVNPGSLGCNARPLARYVLVEVERAAVEIRFESVAYDREMLLLQFEQLQVPDRKIIIDTFFGGRKTLSD